MFLGRVSNWTSVVGTAIPFVTVKNTNNKISNNNGVLSLNKAGIWDIDGAITLTGVDGNPKITVYADGVATQTVVQATTTTTDYVTVPIVDSVKTVIAQYPQVSTISLVIDTAGLTVGGNLRVEYLQ